MRHSGDFAQGSFGEIRVGDHYAKCRVVCEAVFHDANAGFHNVRSAAKAFFVLCQEACDLPSGFPVENIAQGIDGYDRSDLQLANLDRVAADAGFHAGFHAADLSDGSATSSSEVAVFVIRCVKGEAGGFIAHRGVRTDEGVADRQVKEI